MNKNNINIDRSDNKINKNRLLYFWKPKLHIVLEIKPFLLYFWTVLVFCKHFRISITKYCLTIWVHRTIYRFNKHGYSKEKIFYGERKIEAGIFIVDADTGNSYQVWEN